MPAPLRGYMLHPQRRGSRQAFTQDLLRRALAPKRIQPPGQRNAGMTCWPKSSMERMTLSAGMSYGCIRQSSWSQPAS